MYAITTCTTINYQHHEEPTMTRDERQAIRDEHEAIYPGLLSKFPRMTTKEIQEGIDQWYKTLGQIADIDNACSSTPTTRTS